MSASAISAPIGATGAAGAAGAPGAADTIAIKVFGDDVAVLVGDGRGSVLIPATLNGRNLSSVIAGVVTASSSGLPTVQLRRSRGNVDMLSTKVTIDANEKDSSTAATPAVVDGANDDLATGDRIFVDVDVAGTGTAGLDVILILS